MLADLCPCFHQSPTKLCPDLALFACWIVTKCWRSRISVPHLVIRALNCARILVVRVLDCAQFLLHPALFQPSWNTDYTRRADVRHTGGRQTHAGRTTVTHGRVVDVKRTSTTRRQRSADVTQHPRHMDAGRQLTTKTPTYCFINLPTSNEK